MWAGGGAAATASEQSAESTEHANVNCELCVVDIGEMKMVLIKFLHLTFSFSRTARFHN